MNLPMTPLPTQASDDSLYTTPQPLPDTLTSPQTADRQPSADTLIYPLHAVEQPAAVFIAPDAEQQEEYDSVAAQPEEHADKSLTAQTTARPQVYPFRIRCNRDSLWLLEHPRIALRTKAAPRDTTAYAVYGEESTPVRAQYDAPNDRPLTNDMLFQGFVLLLGTIYVLLIYSNIIDVRTLLHRVFRDHATNAEERRFDDPSSGRYVRFIHTMAVIGMLFIGVSVVKYGQPLIELLPFEGAPIVAVLASGLTVSALFLLIAGYQWLLLRTVEALTLTQPLVGQLRQLRTLYFAAVTVLAAPTLLLLALCPPHTGKLWFALIVIELSVTLFLYIKETLILFLSKKVSILHWILYLCSVELFPVSLLWLLAVR